MAESAVKIYKGTNPEVDSYSAFWDNSKMTDTKLAAQLKMRNITDVYVCGVAYDVCVGKKSVWLYALINSLLVLGRSEKFIDNFIDMSNKSKE